MVQVVEILPRNFKTPVETTVVILVQFRWNTQIYNNIQKGSLEVVPYKFSALILTKIHRKCNGAKSF
jgi:hypothetical protein